MARARTRKFQASVIDLFSGAGGLSYGFKSAGFKVVAGIDLDEACRYPYEKNIKAPFICKDVSKLCASDLDELFLPNGARVLVGCAPCQPFSIYNQKNQDPNWRLLRAFAKLIADSQPDIVSMENVPQLLNFRGGNVFNNFIKLLENADYHISWDVLYGPNFGLAQTRSRLVLLASRYGPIELPKPNHSGQPLTVRSVIGKLPRLNAGGVNKNDILHCSPRLGELNKKRIMASKPGGTWRDWPKHLVAKCHRTESGSTYGSVYGRMKWSSPSPTITTQFYGYGNGRFGHPEQNRALSLREGAMLQGFPRDYAFVAPGGRANFKTIGRLVGNAVPVNLAAAIAKAVKVHIRKNICQISAH